MSEEKYNYPRFYNKLRELGPKLLVGLDEDWLGVVTEESKKTDSFFDDGYSTYLAAGVDYGDMRWGVSGLLNLWESIVLSWLDMTISDHNRYCEPNEIVSVDLKKVKIDLSKTDIIDELVEAAKL